MHVNVSALATDNLLTSNKLASVSSGVLITSSQDAHGEIVAVRELVAVFKHSARLSVS